MRAEDIDFNMLHRKAFSPVSKILYRHQNDIDDVIQNAFIKAIQHLPEFQGRSQFSTWFVRIAINEAIYLLRTRKRVFVDLDCALEIPDAKPSPETLAKQAQIREIMVSEINKLSPARRAVMNKFLQGERPGKFGKTAMFWGRRDLKERLAGRI